MGQEQSHEGGDVEGGPSSALLIGAEDNQGSSNPLLEALLVMEDAIVSGRAIGDGADFTDEEEEEEEEEEMGGLTAVVNGTPFHSRVTPIHHSRTASSAKLPILASREEICAMFQDMHEKMMMESRERENDLKRRAADASSYTEWPTVGATRQEGQDILNRFGLKTGGNNNVLNIALLRVFREHAVVFDTQSIVCFRVC